MNKIVILLLVACVACEDVELDQIPGCQGLNVDEEISFDSKGYPIVPREWLVYYPECVNGLSEAYGIERFHVATFEERRRYFGPEWEDMFREEVCFDRTWKTRPPSICTPQKEDADLGDGSNVSGLPGD